MSVRTLLVVMIALVLAAGCGKRKDQTTETQAALPVDSTNVDSMVTAIEPESSGPDLSARCGLARRTSTGEFCLNIADSSLAPGTRVTLIAALKPQAYETAEIVQRRTSPFLPPDANGAPWEYDLKLISEKPTDQQILIGLPGDLPAVRGDSTRVSLDLDGDGVPETFGACMSADGVHFTVWTGPMSERRRRWHRFYKVHYDMKPDCTEPETAARL